MTRQDLGSTASGEGSTFHCGSAAMRQRQLHGRRFEVRDQRVCGQRHEREQSDSPEWAGREVHGCELHRQWG